VESENIFQKTIESIHFNKTFPYNFCLLLLDKDSIILKILDNKLKDLSERYSGPKLEERKVLFDAITKITKDSSAKETQLREENIKKLKNLNEEIENNNVNFYTLINEVFYFYDYYKSIAYREEKTDDEKKFWETLKSKYIQLILSGINTHLLKANPAEIDHAFLREIFQDKTFGNQKFFVISILGVQSSAKSTLLNYLFGTNFETSSGRCTKGIYFSIIKTNIPDVNILLLDTEGLSSIEGQDKVYDNQMALMCFGASNLVLINQKGELSKYLNDLFEISVYAMSYMSNLKNTKSKVFFILRDQVERNPKNQEVALNKLKVNLQEISLKYGFELEELLDINLSNFILLPSAFKEDLIHKSNVKSCSEIFSQDILTLRKKIFDEIHNQKKKGNLRDQTIYFFYAKACNLWKSLSEYGIEILDCKSMKEYELKNQVKEILKVDSEAMIKKIKLELQDLLIPEIENMKKNQKKSNLDYKGAINEEFKNEVALMLKGIKEKCKGIEAAIIDHCLDEVMDFVNAEKKNFQSEWGLKFKIVENQIEAKKFNDKITLKMETEIAEILGTGGKDDQRASEVRETIQNIIDKFKNDIKKNEQKYNIDDILHHCITSFNNDKNTKWNKITPKDIKNKEKGQANNINWVNAKWYHPYEKIKQVFMSDDEKKQKARDLFDFYTRLTTEVFKNYLEEVVIKEICKTFCVRVDNFLNFPENNGKINEEMYKTDISILFIKELSQKIYENLVKKQQDEIQKNLKIIEETGKRNMDLFTKRKDGIGITNLLATNYINDLKKYILKFEAKLELIKIFELELMEIPKDPMLFLNYAYKKSFEEKNQKNIMKFVLNINTYCVEIFEELLSHKSSKIQNSLFKFCKEKVIESINLLKTLINQFFQDVNKKEFLLEEFNDKIEAAFPKEITPNTIYNNKTFVSNDFRLCFLKTIQEFDITPEKIEKKVQKMMSSLIEEKKPQIIGCQRTCPFCESKCIKPAGDHKDHEAKHLICGFGGVQNFRSKQVVLEYCLSKENIYCGWHRRDSPDKSYANKLELCKEEYPEWFFDFNENANKNLLKEKERSLQIECWYLVRAPLLKKHKMLDDTEAPILLQSPLKENFEIEERGY